MKRFWNNLHKVSSEPTDWNVVDVFFNA